MLRPPPDTRMTGCQYKETFLFLVFVFRHWSSQKPHPKPWEPLIFLLGRSWNGSPLSRWCQGLVRHGGAKNYDLPTALSETSSSMWRITFDLPLVCAESSQWAKNDFGLEFSFNLLLVTAGSLCRWRLPSIQSLSICNVDQKSKRSWSWTRKKRQVSFQTWAASKCMLELLTAYTGSLGYHQNVEGSILKLIFLLTESARSNDRSSQESPQKISHFRKSLYAQRRVFSLVGFLRGTVWFAFWSNVTC